MIGNMKYKFRLATGYYSKGFSYVYDKDSTGYREYYKAPAVTLAEGGDCEDWAILVYSRIKADGREEGITFEHWMTPDKRSGHMVLRLKNGQYISNHGKHGKTVRGFVFYKTVSVEEVNMRIKQHAKLEYKL